MNKHSWIHSSQTMEDLSDHSSRPPFRLLYHAANRCLSALICLIGFIAAVCIAYLIFQRRQPLDSSCLSTRFR